MKIEVNTSTLHEHVRFAARAFQLCWEERRLAVTFVVVSILAALSEGVSVLMIIPLLQLDANRIALVPIVGPVLAPLGSLSKSQLIDTLAAIMAAVLVLRGGLQYWNGMLSASLPLKLKLRIAERAYNALISSSLEFVEGADIGTLNAYVEDHPNRVAAAIKSLLDGLFNLATIAVYGILMVAISWKMTTIAAVFVFVLGLATKKLLVDPLELIGRGLTIAQTRLRNVFFDTVHGIRLIHLRRAGAQMQDEFDKAARAYYRHDSHRMFVAVSQSPIVMTAAGLFICVAIIASSHSVGADDTTWFAPLLGFVLTLYRLLTPAVAISNSYAAILGNWHSIEMLDGFFRDASASRVPHGDIPFQGMQTGLVFKNVSFRYSSSEQVVLDNISFEIPRNSLVALVGQSGAGKSSIISLVTRFREPTSGELLLDGLKLRDYELDSWRRRISVVSQQPIIFNDTVLSNICFGLKDVPIARVRDALDLAAAREFVQALPMGLNTSLGDRGVRLSGGEQQRLAISRALVQDFDLLILDEATSHLDALTEQVIQKTITRLRGHKTILVVAHRLATIQRADIILVMQRGRIVERGSHAELMAAGGLYCSMLRHQIIDAPDGVVETP